MAQVVDPPSVDPQVVDPLPSPSHRYTICIRRKSKRSSAASCIGSSGFLEDPGAKSHRLSGHDLTRSSSRNVDANFGQQIAPVIGRKPKGSLRACATGCATDFAQSRVNERQHSFGAKKKPADLAGFSVKWLVALTGIEPVF
jgi:hypothetical protein